MLCGLWGERTTEKVKLLRQFLVIMAVSFVGEILHAVLPLPIPASIYAGGIENRGAQAESGF